VAADIERGVGQQVDGGTLFPHARAVGALGEQAPRAARRMARATAREARRAGIHWAFAPVADVNVTPTNPIIGTRAFGETPDPVAQCTAAYVAGARAEGLLTTAKHFPGHGRTEDDSHATRPVVDASRAALEATDLKPFRRAIDAGVDAIMTAHVTYPALDADEPATRSAPVLRGLLRGEMDFPGVVVSDSLLMEGIQDPEATAGAQAAALVRAGVDVILDPERPEAVVRGLLRAVRDGALSADRVVEAARRVWGLKRRVRAEWGTAAFRPGLARGRGEADAPHAGTGALGVDAHRDLARRIAAQAITVDDPDGLLPLGPDARPIVVQAGGAAGSGAAPDEASTPLEAALRAYWPELMYRRVAAARQPGAARPDVEALAQEARAHRPLVVAVTAEPAAWQAFGLSRAQRQAVRRLVEQQPAVLAALGSPHVLSAFPKASARLCTYSSVRASQQALARRLAGAPVD
jgi:beta-glucosidase-like glycosyl hydrolase